MTHKLTQVIHSPNFIKYAKNSGWMLAEHVMRMISAIFVGIYVARYLGPEQFGILSYTLAIVAVFMAVSRLGMDNVLVRDVAKNPDQVRVYMGTAFWLMLVTAVVNLIVLSGVIYFIENDLKTKIYIWIVSIGLLFQAFLVIDYGFQGQVKAKNSAIAKSSALFFGSLVKIIFVLNDASFEWIVIAYMLDFVFIAMILFFVHERQRQKRFFASFRVELIKPLLKSALPIALLALLGMLLMKFDQIYIQYKLGSESVGIYVASIKLYEAWIMIPQIIMLSLIPALADMKSKSQKLYEKRLIFTLRVIVVLNVFVSLLVFLIANFLIELLYGPSFSSSAPILQIVIWASIFMGLGSLIFRVLVNEGQELKIVKIMLITLIVNIVLNLVLVDFFGITGSAYSMLISLFIGYFLYVFVDSDLKMIKGVMLKAFYVK